MAGASVVDLLDLIHDTLLQDWPAFEPKPLPPVQLVATPPDAESDWPEWHAPPSSPAQEFVSQLPASSGWSGEGLPQGFVGGPLGGLTTHMPSEQKPPPGLVQLPPGLVPPAARGEQEGWGGGNVLHAGMPSLPAGLAAPPGLAPPTSHAMQPLSAQQQGAGTSASSSATAAQACPLVSPDWAPSHPARLYQAPMIGSVTLPCAPLCRRLCRPWRATSPPWHCRSRGLCRLRCPASAQCTHAAL